MYLFSQSTDIYQAGWSWCWKLGRKTHKTGSLLLRHCGAAPCLRRKNNLLGREEKEAGTASAKAVLSLGEGVWKAQEGCRTG